MAGIFLTLGVKIEIYFLFAIFADNSFKAQINESHLRYIKCS